MSTNPLNGKREWSADHEQVRLNARFAIEDSPAMQEVFWAMTRVRWQSNILLTGETGTGKTQAARVINLLLKKSRPGTGSHVEANVASLSKDLIASELFGHVRGAFTGADKERDGRFQQAHKGTLMLDEIGEVPLDTQVKLLSAFDAPRIVQKVGSNDQTNPELVAMVGTTKNLVEMVTAKEFDGALYMRLKQKVIRMPSLHERGPAYMDHIVSALLSKIANGGHPVLSVEPVVMERLRVMRFKGNARELNYLLDEMAQDAYSSNGTVLTERHLDDALASRGSDEEQEAVPSGGSLEDAELAHIRQVFDRWGGNKSAAAKELGISTVTLAKKLAKLGIHPKRNRRTLSPNNL